MTSAELDQLAINTIRTLSIDAVQKANSGHPGTPMALAPLVYTLWNRVMRFDPQTSTLESIMPLDRVSNDNTVLTPAGDLTDRWVAARRSA